jgi:hypothetical protein
MKRILLIGDLHSGAQTSVCRDQAVFGEEKEFTHIANLLQSKYINPHWETLKERPKFDHIALLGDQVDGANRKERGAGVWSVDSDVQVEESANLVLELPATKQCVISVISGSGYHRDTNPNNDKRVVNMLNELGGKGTAKFCGEQFNLKIEDCRINLCHEVSGTFYHGTALNKEIMFSYLYKWDYTGMVRAHRHHFHFDWDGSRFALMVPGWKVRDAYALKFGNRFKSQIGWVEMTIDGDKWDIKPFLKTVHHDIQDLKV